MGSFKLVNSYTHNTDTGYISVSPYWLVCFVGLQTPLSYSRQSRQSVKNSASQGSRSIIIVTDDCTRLVIHNEKAVHTKSLQATFIQGGINYLLEVLPGDWVFAWTFNNETKFKEVYEKVKNGKQANYWDEGLKFIGRVNSVRKQMSLTPVGTKTSLYNIDAFGFKELDTQFFYDQALAERLLQTGSNLSWLARINANISDLFELNKDSIAENNANKLIAKLIKILVGSGVKSEAVNVIPNVPSSPGTTTEEAPYAYMVPGEVAKILGKSTSDASKSSNIISYADLLELYTGVQSYDDNSSGHSLDYQVFNPKTQTTDGIEHFSGKPNLGAFSPGYVGFINSPIWSLLQQYQNPLVNELYTCLRVNDDGYVVPQVIFRQIPFTTPTFAEINNHRIPQVEPLRDDKSQDIDSPDTNPTASGSNNNDVQVDVISGGGATTEITDAPPQIDVTPFHTLPRWVLDDLMIKSLSLGRTDALRTNFVHVYGQNANYASPSIPQQMVLNPPLLNNLDIQYNGLHSTMATVASGFINEVGKAPSAWIDLVTDYSMGAHLTLNGTVETIGVHLPICEGDNVQFENLILHIESVTHNCSLLPNGQKIFTTTLNLSNGIKFNDFSIENGDTDEQNTFYPGFKRGDQRHYDPGQTVSSEYSQIIKRSGQ